MPSLRITPDRFVLLAMLVAAAVYCRDLQYDFILDDVPLILLNETLTSWRNWPTLFVSQITPPQGVDIVAVHYRPVYMSWFMANSRLFGMVLPWWHLTSLLLHLIVIFLVYRVGLKVLREPWPAAIAALFFALHPIHVEAVSYVTAATDLLVAVFTLATFLAYSRFREKGGFRWYLTSVLAAGLAVLSKETAAVLPFLLLAYEAMREHPPGPPQWRKRLVWTLPHFAVVAAYAMARTLLFGLNLGPGPGMDRLRAVADAPLVLLVYLRNLLWPIHLSFYYPDEWSAEWTLPRGIALIVIGIIAVFLWRRYAKRPGVRLQLLWLAILFVIPLASVSAFRKQDWVHDRHMYLVSVPFCFMTAVVLSDAWLSRKLSVSGNSLVAVILLTLTAFQVPRFKDELSVYESALSVAPRNIILRRHYAAALWNAVPNIREPSKAREQALQEFRANIDLWPELPLGHENYAAALAQVGRDGEAAEEFRKALQLDDGGPSHFRASMLYGLAELDLKHSKLDEAERCLREALTIDPRALSYHALLAEVLRQEGHDQEADEQMKVEASVRQQFAQEHSQRGKSSTLGQQKEGSNRSSAPGSAPEVHR